MDRYVRRHRHHRLPLIRPPIAEKCWTDDDLEFWKTGEYDMDQESSEVQIMLDLASELTAARVQWLMQASRDACCEQVTNSYREPKHTASLRSHGYRRGGVDASHSD